MIITATLHGKKVLEIDTSETENQSFDSGGFLQKKDLKHTKFKCWHCGKINRRIELFTQHQFRCDSCSKTTII